MVDLRGVERTNLTSVPPETEKVETKTATYEGRSWTQKIKAWIKAALQIFSRKKTDSPPSIKKDSVRVVNPHAPIKDGKKTEAKPAQAKEGKKTEAKPAQTEVKDAQANKGEISKPEPPQAQEVPKPTSEEKEVKAKSMGNKGEDTVEAGASTVVSVASTIGIGLVAPKDAEKPETTDAKNFSAIVPTKVTPEENEKVFESLQPIMEFRTTEKTHAAAVERDQKILEVLVDPKALPSLSENEKALLNDFAKDFAVYSKLTMDFQKKLEGALNSLDNETVDLAKVAQDLEQLISSDYKALHNISEKIVTYLMPLDPIIRKKEVQVPAENFAQSKDPKDMNPFTPTIHPVQRMTRYPMLLKEMQRKISRLDNLPNSVLADLKKATDIIELSVKSTNESNQIALLKEFINSPKMLKNLHDLNLFETYMANLKVYDAPPKSTIGSFSEKELREAIKMDVSFKEKNISKMLKEIKKDPVKEKSKIARAEAELAKLQFAAENYNVGSRKKNKQRQAMLLELKEKNSG